MKQKCRHIFCVWVGWDMGYWREYLKDIGNDIGDFFFPHPVLGDNKYYVVLYYCKLRNIQKFIETVKCNL